MTNNKCLGFSELANNYYYSKNQFKDMLKFIKKRKQEEFNSIYSWFHRRTRNLVQRGETYSIRKKDHRRSQHQSQL